MSSLSGGMENRETPPGDGLLPPARRTDRVPGRLRIGKHGGIAHTLEDREDELRRATALLNAVSMNTPAIIAVKDRQSRIVVCNPAVLQLVGKPAEEVIGRNDIELVGDEQGAPIIAADQRVISTGAPYSFEEVINGRTFHTSKTPYRNDAGEILGVLVVGTDISERKRTEEKMRQMAESLALAQRASASGVWDWRMAGAPQISVSAEYRDLCGFSPDEPVTPENWFGPIHPGDREAAASHLQTFFGGYDTAYTFEYRRMHPRDGERWIAAIGRLERNAAGNPTRFYGISIDVTERKHAEERLQAAQAKLQRQAADLEKMVAERTSRLRESIAELEHFSYTITHDLRAPLRAMQSFGEILREEYAIQLDGPGSDYLRRIIDAASRMDALITDALNYAKAVQTELTLEPVDPGLLLRGIIESYPQFQVPRAYIELAPDFPRVLANRAGLTQCFSNLLSNAVKFVRKGEIPRVRVGGERRGDVVRLWIEDNGIGIPSHLHARLFAMFERLSTEYEGTGVGLALVRKVVEKMRGKVGVESEPGAGSRFWLELGAAP